MAARAHMAPETCVAPAIPTRTWIPSKGKSNGTCTQATASLEKTRHDFLGEKFFVNTCEPPVLNACEVADIQLCGLRLELRRPLFSVHSRTASSSRSSVHCQDVRITQVHTLGSPALFMMFHKNTGTGTKNTFSVGVEKMSNHRRLSEINLVIQEYSKRFMKKMK